MTSSSSTSNNSINPLFIIPSISNLSFTISIKLNSFNYLVWKAQTLPYFRGHGVFGYIDSTISIPPQEINALHPSTGARIKILNPHYIQWLHQDSLILATINASLTEDVFTQIMSYTTSHEVWLALKRTFSSISRAKTIWIRTQLENVCKGALSVNAYFLSIKQMADKLALVGQPLIADDIITYVLMGLGQEYDSLASIITSHSDLVTLEELYSLLLICESRINYNNQPLQATALVNVATKHPLQPHPSSSHMTAKFHHSNRSHEFYCGRGHRPCFNSNNHGPSNSITCQLCFKPGHSTRQCYHRFNLSYQDPHTLLRINLKLWLLHTTTLLIMSGILILELPII
jgi:hypothetical protein